MTDKNRTMINVICSIGTLIINLLINFFLSPYIIDHIGVEANGFVVLANNFVTYAQLIVSALNSMVGRYIIICYVKKDYKKANLYYNSVFWGDLIIVLVLIVPAVFFIAQMERMIDVPMEILKDVKILFSFIFLNFFLTTGLPNWESGAYVTNRLDRVYIPQVFCSLFRGLFFIIVFNYCLPKVWYIGLAATITSAICLFINAYNTHILTPHLKIVIKRNNIIFSKDTIIELLGAGIWNSINNVGHMLLSGLDLLICNATLGSVAMGIISVSKILPDCLRQLSVAISDAFAPELTINYAQGDVQKVYDDIKRAMKITTILLTIPLAGIIVLGEAFYSLWVPTQDAKVIYCLAILNVFGFVLTCGIQIIYNVFTTVNRVKENAIAMLFSGIISVVITIIVIETTDYGMYAVVGVSTVVNMVRNMCYTLPRATQLIGFKWYKFYPQVGISIICTLIITIIGVGIRNVIIPDTWLDLIVNAITLGVFGVGCNCLLIFNKAEKEIIRKKIMQRINKGR